MQHVPGEQNVVADTLSRPSEAVPTSESTPVAGVKVPSGLLAASQVVGRTGRASPLLVAAATADGVDLLELAKAQKVLFRCSSSPQQLFSSPPGFSHMQHHHLL